MQGGNKKEATATFGEAQVKLWRRSYATPPPPLELDDPRHPAHDPRYRDVAPTALPAAECLADVVRRVVPYWEDVLGPELLRGVTPFVVAHGNSIRAFTMFLEHISEDDIVGLDIPTGYPRVITLDDNLGFVEGRYLGDQEAVAAAAAAVAAQAGPVTA